MQNVTTTSFFSLILLITSCTDKPSDKDVEISLMQHFKNSVKITELKCNYEKWPEIRGTKMYSVTFYCNLEFKDEFNKNENVVVSPNSMTFPDDTYKSGDKYRIDSGIMLFTDIYDKSLGNPTSMDLQRVN